MDVVAKDGKVIMHYISEHIDNVGVHSGDVHPPQDLHAETVRRIEDATMKIGNVLKVTGPFNIQFMAKNNEIKVIECNLRAARSFPFVSKVLGRNFIDTATAAIVGQDVPEPTDIMAQKRDYTAIKVSQFSWTRLAGADPFLGVGE